jgi:hypothetical protein
MTFEKNNYQKFTIEKNQFYGLQVKLRNSMKINFVFHVSLLDPYRGSTTLRRILEPPTPIEVNGEHEYKVDKNLDS